ncbi:hypothetical protein I6N91_09980 [Arthrobacter sp. MSA 4-2]|uniref:hypothetical protein n=1 Tax=Arthrobacter sp. MSA 4-2 TaxID=2794349 RepID=UPI0018E7CCDF|nr:hypothetical protein [Arthrobacter sp. MSA 4-2]MBJ2121306.1 hypothetical protein [Arthrobacter sp. MSA 4-2]
MSWFHPKDQLPESEHLREDINLPEAGHESAGEFSEEAYTSTQLNAGQFVPGLSPHGEYRHELNPEHFDEPGDGRLVHPEES